jgi:hypothetical protein
VLPADGGAVELDPLEWIEKQHLVTVALSAAAVT